MSSSIPPSEEGHENIPRKSGEHDERELVFIGDTRYCREPDSCREKYESKSEQLTSSIRDETEFSTECRLEIAHDRTIDESKEREKSRNEDGYHGCWRVISREPWSNKERESDDDNP